MISLSLLARITIRSIQSCKDLKLAQGGPCLTLVIATRMSYSFSQDLLATLGVCIVPCIPIPSYFLRHFVLGKPLYRFQMAFVSRCDIWGSFGGATVPRVLWCLICTLLGLLLSAYWKWLTHCIVFWRFFRCVTLTVRLVLVVLKVYPIAIGAHMEVSCLRWTKNTHQ